MSNFFNFGYYLHYELVVLNKLSKSREYSFFIENNDYHQVQYCVEFRYILGCNANGIQ